MQGLEKMFSKAFGLGAERGHDEPMSPLSPDLPGRATRYGKVVDYATTVEEELCLVVQVETVAGLEALDDIATTDGVDAVFFGPADLSASMGYPGQMTHPEVNKAIEAGLERLHALGVPGGVMALDEGIAKRFMKQGVLFTAVAVDLVLLADAVEAVRNRF